MQNKEELTELSGQPTLEQQKVIEDTAIDKFEKGDKPYRKVYRPSFETVTCYDCGVFQDLRLITTSEPKSSFKRIGHKKNRNKTALLTPEGNKVYMCTDCMQKRAKSVK